MTTKTPYDLEAINLVFPSMEEKLSKFSEFGESEKSEKHKLGSI